MYARKSPIWGHVKTILTVCGPLVTGVLLRTLTYFGHITKRNILSTSCWGGGGLAYGWLSWKLNWPIRIQYARKSLLSWLQCKLTGLEYIQIRQLFSLEAALNIREKGFAIPKTLSEKNMKLSVSQSIQFGVKNGSPAFDMATPSLIVCQVPSSI